MATKRATKPARPIDASTATVAVLEKRAKAGDAEALAELVRRTGDDVQQTVIAVTNAIGRAGTPEAYAALVRLVLESSNPGCAHVAMTQLDRATKKSPAVVELVIAMCEDPRVDAMDYPITLLSGLVHRDAELGEDPRIVRIMRRAIAPTTRMYAQQAAVAALVRIGDRASLPAIVALFDQEYTPEKKRGPELWRFCAQAVDKLGGGAPELAKLRDANTRRTSRESILDREIEKIARRVER